MNDRKLPARIATMVNRLLPWAPRQELRDRVRQAGQARQEAERAQREIADLHQVTGNRIAERLAREIRAGRHLRPGQQP